MTVAATHTVGVLVLGLVLTASQRSRPRASTPWLGLASGVTFVALVSPSSSGPSAPARDRRLLVHGHHHALRCNHHHDHDGAGHHAADHGARPHMRTRPSPTTTTPTTGTPITHTTTTMRTTTTGRPRPRCHGRRLLTLGFAAASSPRPPRSSVLLGATAIGRAWFGVVLVLAYGVGMAATLVGAGLLLARSRRRFELRARSERFLRYATFFPIATAVVVTGSGLWLVARAAVSV